MLATGANAQLVLKEIRTSNMIVTILMNVGKHWGFEKVFATILLEASLAPSVLPGQTIYDAKTMQCISTPKRNLILGESEICQFCTKKGDFFAK